MAEKIFGVGLNKTGTKTLAACFAHLGRRHLGVRPDLLAKFRQGRIDEVLAEIDPFETFEDWPYPLLYKELFFRYGERARFVLTKRRSPEIWLTSLKRHSLRTDPERHCRLLAYGYAYPHGVEAHHLQFYERHASDMVAFFRGQGAAHLLLEVCWETGDGWEQLCPFLDMPAPAEPFPYRNRTAELPDVPEVERRNLELIRAQCALLYSDCPL